MESEASFDRSSRGRGEPESAKARFFQVQRIRSVGVLLSRCLSVESQTCVGGKAWGEGRREGKDTHGDLLHAADFHIGSVLSITKIHHSVDTLESIRGMNRLFRSIDRSIDGSLMKIVNARETWWEGRGEDGGTRCKCSQRATTRLFDCLYIIGRTDGIFLLLLLLDVKERKKANGWIYEGRRRLKFFQWNRRSEVFSFFLFFFLANRLFRLSRKWFVSYGIKWIQKLLKRKRVYE